MYLKNLPNIVDDSKDEREGRPLVFFNVNIMARFTALVCNCVHFVDTIVRLRTSDSIIVMQATD